MFVKSIYLIDLKELMTSSFKEVLIFKNEYQITSKSDLTNLFIAKVVDKMIQKYKESNHKFIVFFISTLNKQEILDIKEDINFKKFFSLISKTVDFPIIESNLEFELFYELLKGDCPEYDEILQNHRSFAEIFPHLVKVIKKYKFHKINNELLKNQRNMLIALSSL